MSGVASPPDSRRTINPDTLIRNRGARRSTGSASGARRRTLCRYDLVLRGIKGEYLMLTYANDANRAVSLHLISRYAAGGAEEKRAA